nr:MFS transporter [uncultured Desulfobacter sp.]
MLSDRISKHKILIWVFLMAALAYLLMPFFHNLYVLSLLASVVGLAFGVLFTVSAPLVSECFGLENFGRVFGLVFTAYGFVAGFLGPWMSGVVLNLTHDNFSIVFTGFAFFYMVSAILVNQVKQV